MDRLHFVNEGGLGKGQIVKEVGGKVGVLRWVDGGDVLRIF